MVNKAKMLEKIAELVKEKKIEVITEIRDESDKDGLRVVIEVIKGDSVERIEKIVKWELAEQNRLRETADFKEGIKASLERRNPNFTGD